MSKNENAIQALQGLIELHLSNERTKTKKANDVINELTRLANVSKERLIDKGDVYHVLVCITDELNHLLRVINDDK